MKKFFLKFLFLLVCQPLHFCFSQFHLKIDFTDKNNSLYSTGNPEVFLSARAIERRHKQNIGIAENDLPVNDTYVSAVLNKGNINLLNTSKWLNSITVSVNDSSLIDSIKTLPFVKKAEHLRVVTMKTSFDKFFEESQLEDSDFSLKNVSAADYGFAFNQTKMIGLDYLHSLGYRGEGLLIAVIDAGFINTNSLDAFEHLFAQNKIIATKNFVDGSTEVFKDATHGTHVLSIMAANLPGLFVGTAPEAKYLLLLSEDVRSETIIEEFNWVAAAEFADSSGADIINSSLGYTTFDEGINNHSYSHLDGNTAIATIGADIAASKGIFVVNSAGNSGSSPWNFIVVPSDGDSVLAVGATDANGNYVSFSSKGPSFDGRIKPNVAAQGHLTSVFSAIENKVVQGSGTSFSAPVISGAVACLWQSAPKKNNMEIFDAVQKSASQYNFPDSLLGFGIPDFISAYEILHQRKVPRNENAVVMFPNPFSEKLTVSVFSLNTKPATIELFDLRGRLIFYSEKILSEGLNDFEFYAKDVHAHSVFIFRLKSENVLIKEIIVKI